MKAWRREIIELWQRTQEVLRATQTLIAAGFPDFAAARAYYAAFYAASTLLHGSDARHVSLRCKKPCHWQGESLQRALSD
jgi:uncharacterized protein (UPF0332 family)